jgi:hypothetical protein
VLSGLGFAGLLAILGTFAGVLWTLVLGVGGAPGSALANPGVRYESRTVVRTGTAITFLADAYLLLAGWGWLPSFRL